MALETLRSATSFSSVTPLLFVGKLGHVIVVALQQDAHMLYDFRILERLAGGIIKDFLEKSENGTDSFTDETFKDPEVVQHMRILLKRYDDYM